MADFPGVNQVRGLTAALAAKANSVDVVTQVDYEQGTGISPSAWLEALGLDDMPTIIAQALPSVIAALPTTEPVATGALWLDGGHVSLSPGIPPTITDQPDPVTIEEDNTATFSVTATNATSYQWQLDTGSGFANINGATSANYTTPVRAVANNGDEYRCRVTGPGGVTNSSVAVLTVTAIDPDYLEYVSVAAERGWTYDSTYINKVKTFFNNRTNTSPTANFYVHLNTGNNASDGLTAGTAKRTMAAGFAQLVAAGGGVLVVNGTGTEVFTANAIDVSGGTVTGVYQIHFLGTCTMDMDAAGVPFAGGLSPDSGSNNAIVMVYGHGNLTCLDSKFDHAADNVFIADCTLGGTSDDCLTTHGQARMIALGVTTNAQNDCYHQTGSGWSYFKSCIFNGGSVVNDLGRISDTVSGAFLDCQFNKHASFTIGRASMERSTVRRCIFRFGTVGLSKNCVINNSTIEDCYMQGVGLWIIGGSVVRRCYGPNWIWAPTLSPSAQASTIEHNVVNGGSNWLHTDSYNASTAQNGSGNVRNNVIANTTDATNGPVFCDFGFRDAFNAQWVVSHNCRWGNARTPNPYRNITTDGNDVNANPLLVNPTTENQADWCVANNSPCVGAGTSGANIGFTLADIT